MSTTRSCSRHPCRRPCGAAARAAPAATRSCSRRRACDAASGRQETVRTDNTITSRIVRQGAAGRVLSGSRVGARGRRARGAGVAHREYSCTPIKMVPSGDTNYAPAAHVPDTCAAGRTHIEAQRWHRVAMTPTLSRRVLAGRQPVHGTSKRRKLARCARRGSSFTTVTAARARAWMQRHRHHVHNVHGRARTARPRLCSACAMRVLRRARTRAPVARDGHGATLRD